MAKIHQNNVRSLILDRNDGPTSKANGHNHFRLLRTSFSGVAFRRKIFDALSCGGSSRFGREIPDDKEEEEEEEGVYFPMAKMKTETESRRVVDTEKGNVGKEEKRKEVKGCVSKSEKLLDLLNLAEGEAETDEIKKKEEALEELKIVVVKDLQSESEEQRREAAGKVRALAKENSETRVTLAMLGAIPPLAGMLDLQLAVDHQVSALYALLNLGIGNDLNKAAIVKAGAVHKMIKIIDSPDAPNPSVLEAIVANFLGLSALDSNKPIIGSSGAVPFLVKTLKNSDNKNCSQVKHDALRALYNLSIFTTNISFILETDLIPYLLEMLGDMELSERILSILSNVVSTPEGRKAISMVPDGFPILVDVLNWNDSPGCQEKASYVLMVMVHKSRGDRQAMMESGIVSALLELTLLGSTLAQKRASRILECLTVDKGKQVSKTHGGSLVSGSAVSAPICGSSSTSSNQIGVTKECLEDEDDMMSEEKKAVKQLVQQSLQNNMKRIVKRANLPQDFVPSEHFKSLTSSSTSKSLPF